MTSSDTSTRPSVKVTSVNTEQLDKNTQWMIDLIKDSMEEFLSYLEGQKITPNVNSFVVDQIYAGFAASYRADVAGDDDCAKDESFSLKP